MIERQNINGREAIVSYFNDGFEPGDRDSKYAKIVFDDGETVFVVQHDNTPSDKR